MNLTKDEARKLLENKILTDERLPIYDEIIYKIGTKNSITDYTFRGLIKYIYELQDIK